VETPNCEALVALAIESLDLLGPVQGEPACPTPCRAAGWQGSLAFLLVATRPAPERPLSHPKAGSPPLRVQLRRLAAVKKIQERGPSHPQILHADKGYDSNAIGRHVEGRRDSQHSAQNKSQVEELLLAVPLSSAQRHRAHVLPLERRHPSGTRYDRNAVNFLTEVCIAATVSYWL
jgi:hypothetical protein